MPKSLIVYFSQGGTTARVAESIATGLLTAEYRVDLCNMKDEQPPDLGGYDLLGIGSPTVGGAHRHADVAFRAGDGAAGAKSVVGGGIR